MGGPIITNRNILLFRREPAMLAVIPGPAHQVSHLLRPFDLGEVSVPLCIPGAPPGEFYLVPFLEVVGAIIQETLVSYSS